MESEESKVEYCKCGLIEVGKVSLMRIAYKLPPKVTFECSISVMLSK